MEFRQMEYFIKVAELESITKAAVEFNISQPAMSKMIAQLEWELGTKLFDRVSRHLYLNERGKILLVSIKNSMNELNDGINKVKSLSKEPMGKVTIGTFAAHSIIPDSLSAYSQKYQHVKFFLYGNINLSLDLTNYDILFFTDKHLFNNYEVMPILSEKSVVIVNKDHRLAHRSEIELLELKNDPFVFFNSLNNDYTYIICLKAGFTPTIAYQIDGSQMKPDLINNGSAVGIIPELCIEDYKRAYTNLVFLPIKSMEYKRTIYIGWKRDSYLTEAAKSYKDFAVEFYKNYNPK